MIHNLPSDFDLFELENRIRALLSELVTPIIHKLDEHESMLQNATKMNRDTEMNLHTLSLETAKSISRLVPYDFFNKKLDYILSETKSSVEFVGNTIQSLNDKVDLSIHNYSDLNSKIKFVEEGEKENLKTIEDNYKKIKEFQEMINSEISKMRKSLVSSFNQQQLTNDTASEKMNKLNTRLNELNTKALPELMLQIEKRNFQVEEIKLNVKEIRESHKDLKSSFHKSESESARRNHDFIEELKELKTYIDEMLRIEISCGISDMLIKILDSRNVKKLIPIIETQLSTIDSISLGSTSQKNSSFQMRLKTLNLINSFTETLALVKEREKDKPSIERKATRRDSSRSIKQLEELKIALELERNIRLQQESQQTLKLQEEANRLKAIEQIIIIESTIIKEEPTAIVVEKQSKIPEIQIHKEIEVVQNELTDRSNVSAESAESSESFERLASEVKRIDEGLKDFISFFQPLLTKTKEEFILNFAVISNELGQLKKSKANELADTNIKIENVKKDLCENCKAIEDLRSTINNFGKNISKNHESLKMIYYLITQDEEDRQSLQLTCYSENKPRSKSPVKQKAVATLKPECLSCNAQSSIILSAFKMACLNYCPSDINYNRCVYARKGLIEKLGDHLGCISNNSIVINTEDTPKSRFTDEDMIFRTRSATRVKSSIRSTLDTSLKRSYFIDANMKKSSRGMKLHS